MCWMMEGVISHVVFAVKNSRYDWQKVKRKKPAGFIAPTFPFFEGEGEEFLINILCNTAKELGLRFASFNFCGDHVHAVLITENIEISKTVGLWKGKSAYLYNRRDQLVHENSQSQKQVKVNQNLWAKSFFHKIINTAAELDRVNNYIINNRKKHGLEPLSDSSIKIISTLFFSINQ